METINKIRQFNRTVTHQIGALEEEFLGRNRSLGASRVLFEIGSSDIGILELCDRLDLDSRYINHLLQSLEEEGLVQISQSTKDTRAGIVSLTAAGRDEVASLNYLSDEAAASFLEPLNKKKQAALIEAMETVERLLKASAVTIDIEDPSSETAKKCINHYYRELDERFDDNFDPDLSISADPEELTPPQGFFVVARLYGRAIGCGALKCHSDYGEIKRMWVATSTRGLGLGRRILKYLEELAREQNLPVLRLETNKSLKEAQALYRSSGYQEVEPFNDEPYAHHWFEKKL